MRRGAEALLGESEGSASVGGGRARKVVLGWVLWMPFCCVVVVVVVVVMVLNGAAMQLSN